MKSWNYSICDIVSQSGIKLALKGTQKGKTVCNGFYYVSLNRTHCRININPPQTSPYSFCLVLERLCAVTANCICSSEKKYETENEGFKTPCYLCPDKAEFFCKSPDEA